MGGTQSNQNISHAEEQRLHLLLTLLQKTFVGTGKTTFVGAGAVPAPVSQLEMLFAGTGGE